MSVAKNNDLGTTERIHGKIEKMKQDDAVEIQGLRDSLSVLQTREKDFINSWKRLTGDWRERAKELR